MPAPPLTSPLRLALGLGALLLLGLLVVAAARVSSGRWSAGWRSATTALALAWVAGPAVAAPLVFAAASFGLPLRGRPMGLLLSLTLLLAAVAVVLVRRSSAGRTHPAAEVPAEVPAGGRSSSWPGLLALCGAVGLGLWKVADVRLWSWDHFAIWGAKARLFAAAGNLDPVLVDRFDLVPTVPDYPLGVPIAWLTATLGALPDDRVVRVFHLGWVVALLILVLEAGRRLSGDRLVATAGAAFVAVSPLVWDSVHLGLADLPLALYAVAGVATALSAAAGADGRSRQGEWALAGLFVGFLPWVKSEGASLALLLAVPIVLWQLGRRREERRRRELAAFAFPALLVGGSALAIGRFVLPQGVSFFDGQLAARLSRRLADPGEVLGPMGVELAQWDWLGVWPTFVVVLCAAGWRGARLALALGTVVALQLGLYTAVFFTTYIDAADHVATALPRIAAALVPLVALTAAALAARPSGPTFARRMRS